MLCSIPFQWISYFIIFKWVCMVCGNCWLLLAGIWYSSLKCYYNAINGILLRQIGLEQLKGKILAIDISIWINQFITAMRDNEGNVLVNAHLVGTLRRILKLLFYGIRPVFVFDGKTPQLKYQTVQLRRALKEKESLNLNLSSRKLLLLQLKQKLIASKSNHKTVDSIAPKMLIENENSVSPSTFTNLSTSFKISPSTISNSMPSSDIHEYELNDSLESEDGMELSMDEEDILNDVDKLVNLPASRRKQYILQAKSKQNALNRHNYLLAAIDPVLYSQTQLSNFMKTR